MRCRNCNSSIEIDDKFCVNCGIELNEENKILDSEIACSNINSQNNTISLILGIMSCVFSIITVISLPLSIVSIILGINYKRETNNRSIGLILGIIGITLTIIFIIIYLILGFTVLNIISNPVEEQYNYPTIEKDNYDHIGGYL